MTLTLEQIAETWYAAAAPIRNEDAGWEDYPPTFAEWRARAPASASARAMIAGFEAILRKLQEVTDAN